MKPEDVLLEQYVGLYTQAIPYLRDEVPRKYFLTADGLLVAPYLQAVGETLKKIGLTEKPPPDEDAGWKRAVDAGFLYKTWLTWSDGRVRSLHWKRQKELRDIQERFSIQVGDIGPMHPRDRRCDIQDWINCRCMLAFSMG